MKNSDRLRDFWKEKPKKTIKAWEGIITSVQIAGKALDAGEIAFLHNRPMGIALKPAEPGDKIPVLIYGVVR